MNTKQILKNDISKAITEISSLSSNDCIRVKDLYIDLTNRFRSLQPKDFQTKTQYEIYQRMLKIPLELYQYEIKALENCEEYAFSENYFQIKMSLIGYIGWLDADF